MKKRLFYGWIIVFASFIITFAGLGVINSTSGILIKPICDSLGFARGEFTFHRTIMILVGAFLMPLYARIYRRIGVKKVLFVCIIAMAAVTYAYSFSTRIWHFYLIALINGIFICGPSFMTARFLINNWFKDKRGFVTGIAFAGAGIGTAVFIPIAGYVAESMDWQAVYRFVGIAIFVIMLPTVILLVRENPQSMGLTPYTEKTKADSGEKSESQETGIMFRQAIKTPIFWMLIISFFLLSIMAGGPNFNSIPYLTDIGYPVAFASFVMSLLMITHMLGNVSLGGFFDRFGILTGSIFLSLCCIIFPILALNAANPVFVWIYAVFYGPASAGFSVPVILFVSLYFGRKDFAAIFSVFNMAGQLGTALSGPSMAVIYDMTGSYFWGWIMLIAFGTIILICLSSAYFLKKKNTWLSATEQLTEKKAI
jgi:MFS family permease